MQDDELETGGPKLKDGGHVILSCSNCNAGLADIYITLPDSGRSWKVKATCPFCNESSFTKQIIGDFHHGGYGKIKEDDEEDDIPSTICDGFDVSPTGVIVFNIKKANDNAKPIICR